MAMTAVKFSLCSSAALLLILLALSGETQVVQSQNCAAELNNLSACAQYVLPGQPDSAPSAECCSAIQQVDQGCLCNTLRVAARMPTACHLPPLTCGA